MRSNAHSDRPQTFGCLKPQNCQGLFSSRKRDAWPKTTIEDGMKILTDLLLSPA